MWHGLSTSNLLVSLYNLCTTDLMCFCFFFSNSTSHAMCLTNGYGFQHLLLFIPLFLSFMASKVAFHVHGFYLLKIQRIFMRSIFNAQQFLLIIPKTGDRHYIHFNFIIQFNSLNQKDEFFPMKTFSNHLIVDTILMED